MGISTEMLVCEDEDTIIIFDLARHHVVPLFCLATVTIQL